MRDDRGQMQTIEGVSAAFIVIVVLAVIVQTTSVTPLSSSFTNQHIKLELENVGNDILSTLDQTRTINTSDPATPSLLKYSITSWALFNNYGVYTWNNTSFVSPSGGSYNFMTTQLTNALQFALSKNGTAFNVELRFPDTDGTVHTAKMIWDGDPSENSVTVSRFIVLHDADVSNDDSVIPDISPTTDLHNTVEVRLTLWVM